MSGPGNARWNSRGSVVLAHAFIRGLREPYRIKIARLVRAANTHLCVGAAQKKRKREK